MLTLVVGGAASGKSELAEELVLASPHGRRIYIATMQPMDDECRKRIERHRQMRAEKRFETIERYTDLAGAEVSDGSVVLLECMSNLCANEMFGPAGSGRDALSEIMRGVRSIAARCGELIIVSNEVFSGGGGYGADTLEYMKLLGGVNRCIAAEADRVCEVVCGIHIWHKGGSQ